LQGTGEACKYLQTKRSFVTYTSHLFSWCALAVLLALHLLSDERILIALCNTKRRMSIVLQFLRAITNESANKYKKDL